jgi:hypothetical protein
MLPPDLSCAGQSTVANTNARRPLYPDFGRFSIAESVVNSSYHSLQASLDRRYSNGLTILASYTFSKALTDLNSVLTNNGGVPDPENRRLEWGPAEHDRTHALVASWVWQIPYGAAMRGISRVLLHGWELNGIWSAYSGSPLSFSTSQDRALRGHPNRPDRLRDARLPSDRSREERIAATSTRLRMCPTASANSAMRHVPKVSFAARDLWILLSEFSNISAAWPNRIAFNSALRCLARSTVQISARLGQSRRARQSRSYSRHWGRPHNSIRPEVPVFEAGGSVCPARRSRSRP